MVVGGGGCTLDYNISSGPFLSFEIEILTDLTNKLKSLKVAK